MFEELKLVVSVEHNEFDKRPENNRLLEIVRKDPHTLAIKEVEPNAEAVLRMGSSSSFFTESSSSMQFPLKASAQDNKSYYFDEIVGPNFEWVHLHEKLQPQDLEDACMNTFLSVSRLNPTMIQVRSPKAPNGELLFVLKDLQKLVDPQDKSAALQLSTFSFVNGSLVDLLQTEKTQMLFNFDLNYREFSASDPHYVFHQVKDSYKDCMVKHEARVIFFYIVLRTQKGIHKQTYLMGDFFNPFDRRKTPLQINRELMGTSGSAQDFCRCCEGKVCSVKARYDADFVYHNELLILKKYICFNTPHREMIQEEQANSLDIFFSELVQERNNRMVINVNLPRLSKSEPSIEILLDIAATIQKSVTVFNSYLFQLVHSQTRQSIPLRLTQVEPSEDSRQADLPTRAKSRRNSVFSSARKSLTNMIQMHKMSREPPQEHRQGEPRRMDMESQPADPPSFQNRHQFASTIQQPERPLNPFSRMLDPTHQPKSLSQPEIWGHQRTIEAESSQPLPQTRSDLFPGSQSKGQQQSRQMQQPQRNQQKPPQVSVLDLLAIDELLQLPLDDPKRAEQIVVRCCEHLIKRSDRLDIFVDYQNQLFKELQDLTQLSSLTQKQSISTLNSLVETERTDHEYVKHLLVCLAEYKNLKDPTKKMEIKRALENNLMHLEPKHIAGLLELIGEAEAGTQMSSREKF